LADPDDLEASWSVLETAGTDLGIVALPLAAAIPGSRELLLGVENGLHRYLLVGVPPDFHTDRSRVGPGLTLAVRDLVLGDRSGRYIALSCRKPLLNQLFTSLVVDCLNGLESTQTNADVAIDEVIERWEELIDKEAGRSLSREMLTGLAGELLVLTDMQHLGHRALSRWLGPLGGRHDFTNGLVSVEVKSTTSHAGKRVSISGLEQLLPQPGGKLFVEFVRLELVPDNGTSPAELIRAAVNSGISEVQLRARLESLGISSDQWMELEAFRFHVIERHF
jgi:hypothetical protein